MSNYTGSEIFSSKTKVDKKDSKLVLANMIWVSFALLIGGTAGLLQTLVRSGQFELPFGIGYYQLLTLHGVILALVMTFFFIMGFQIAALSRTAGSFSTSELRLGWTGFWVMTAGTLMSAAMIALNEASVLYTFYAPLQAHAVHYIGLALVIVGTWISVAGQLMRYFRWRKENKGQKTPLLSYMTAINNVMWIVCTIGVAATVLFQFIPWSLGWVETINISLSRTLFWYFGHPLVYFWLLPAYMVWYAVIPKVLGTKGFSDNLARLAFVLFLFFSIPVGIHHQLVDPGIDAFWKGLQVVLTFMVIVPSLMTAFSMFAVFETYGRKQGARGLLDWFKKLPWTDARFVLVFIGMLFFIPGGLGGIINASGQMNQLVHNTIWIVGHFHITVGAPVILTYFAAMLFLLPHITGRKIDKIANRLGLFLAYTWALGMGIMSLAMHWAGLRGAPRRSTFSEYGGADIASEWITYQVMQAVGGSFLFIAIIIAILLFLKLTTGPKVNDPEEFPVAMFMDQEEPVVKWVENWRLLIIITIFLILIAYTVPVTQMFTENIPGAKGFKLW
ncbi:b(o/a)3-type cytochrome-c oxidase subunit 1 [Jeotgalicoccus nanhaiensis]|uniref:B(O/a)3-type cytochrome-c oxidase subunit 1 n=1 Tax=Jeotgalicoccus nanhaiensis TaxID=568603 RepID=A0ABR9XWU8_9STAP|nr:b(o/a)3-type cytochrome-c oxidase subunit 1 [Jeotgalicoccus nanhaiensis]MBF0753215.1 b(o/a)3-type cytochrome-c oxidase subunit 1 [Jeotgalicoccus nanhaiensis]TFU62385.1 b(o/a)3-type cytochrome-c oxidase subunit 1 [Jeotgalicoccus nanhaiensis]